MRHIFPIVVALIALFSSPVLLYAQVVAEQRSYTAPREKSEWVTLGNSQDMKYECDLNSLIRLDSTHVRIHIKETPIKQNHYETVRAKMWEHRSIQGYSDSLQRKPQFYFEGYENYGFTINEELIESGKGSYTTIYTADYNLSGILLCKSDAQADQVKPVIEKSPEQMVIDLVVKGKAKVAVNN